MKNKSGIDLHDKEYDALKTIEEEFLGGNVA